MSPPGLTFVPLAGDPAGALAGILVDQAEELPFDVYSELKGRLSQPGYHHQLIVTPNPPSEGHWLATEFPEDNRKPTHRYVRFTLRDNLVNLGEDTVEAIEAAYPQGTSQHRRLIEGRRGERIVIDAAAPRGNKVPAPPVVAEKEVRG